MINSKSINITAGGMMNVDNEVLVTVSASCNVTFKNKLLNEIISKNDVISATIRKRMN